MVYRCNLCAYFIGSTLCSLLNHLGRIHKNDAGFHSLCGVDGCSRTYTNYYSLRNHVYRKHEDLLKKIHPVDHNNDDEPLDREQEPLEADLENPNEEENEEGMGNPAFDVATEVKGLVRSNALCLLQIKDEGKIPQTVVDHVVKNTTQVVENTVDLLKSSLTHCFQNAGIDMENIPGVSDLFNENCAIRKPFSRLENESSQLSYYKNNLGPVVR